MYYADSSTAITAKFRDTGVTRRCRCTPWQEYQAVLMTLRGDAGLRIKKCISIYHFQTKKLKILLVRGLAPLQASSPYNMLA